MMTPQKLNLIPRFLCHFFCTALAALLLSSCAGIIYSPGNTVPFNDAASWNFDDNNSNNYSLSDSSIQVSNGTARLKQASQEDNDQTGFEIGDGGTFAGGAIYDSTNSILRLGENDPNLELDASWTPAWEHIVGYWKLNGTIGNVASNATVPASVGSDGITSNSNNSGMTYAAGPLKQAMTFDGIDDCISIPYSDAINLTDNFSIQAWVLLNTTNTGGENTRIIGRFFAGGFALVQMASTAKIGIISSGIGNVATSTSPLSLTTWTHVLVTKSGSSTKVYINGMDDTTLTSNTFSANSSIGLEIGCTNTSDFYFNGSIDDVAIWNTALSTTAVQTIYEHQIAKYAGTFESRVMDAYSDSQPWSSLEWIPTLPFYKALPDGGQSESRSSYSSLSSDSLMNGLVGLWHLDEPAGTSGAGSIKDNSGNHNNGTPQNTTLGSAGVLQSGAAFTGSNPSGITIPNSSSLNISSNQITVSAWAKFNSWYASSAKLDALVTKGWDNHTSGFYRIGAHDTGGSGAATGVNVATFNISRNNTVGYLGGVTGNTNLQLGQWYHIVGVYDGSNSYIYLNGHLDHAPRALSGNIGTGTSPLVIGNEFSNTYFTNGSIDEVAIWNRALDPSEVLQLYRRGANRIKFQVRSCSDIACSSGSPQWLGPDVDSQSYFSELYNTSNNSLMGAVSQNLPTMNFANLATLLVPNNRYFQYRAILESDDANNLCDYGSGAAPCSPELKSVHVGPDHYDNSAPTIGNTTGVTFSKLSSATCVLGANGCSNDGTSTDATRYILSSNNTTWYYWNGSAWTVSNQSYNQATSISDLSSDALATFVNSAGAGKFYYKAFLKSDGTHPCEIDELNFTGQ